MPVTPLVGPLASQVGVVHGVPPELMEIFAIQVEVADGEQPLGTLELVTVKVTVLAPEVLHETLAVEPVPEAGRPPPDATQVTVAPGGATDPAVKV